jgi:hypothetical protein
VKIVEFPVGYRDTADLRAAGYGDYASLIDAAGVPQLRRADAQVYAAWQQERDLPRIAADDLPF